VAEGGATAPKILVQMVASVDTEVLDAKVQNFAMGA